MTDWKVPSVVHGNGDFLCTCSNVAVGSELMLNGPHTARNSFGEVIPRACVVDRSLERHRYICAYFWQHNLRNYLSNITVTSTSLKNSIRVLHNAPEKCLAEGLQLFNQSDVDYIGFDYEVGGLVYKSSLNEFKIDLGNMPFPDKFANLLISSHVLEHVPDIDAVLREIYRVLKEGGIAILAAPVNPRLKETKEKHPERKYTPAMMEKEFGQLDHVRYIGMDFRQKIEKAGFETDPETMTTFFQRFFPEGKTKYKNREFLESHGDLGVVFAYKPMVTKASKTQQVQKLPFH
jgi:SAM-dependent methyltransferase